MWAEIKKNHRGITTYSIQKRPHNEFVYLEVCLRFDFRNVSFGVRTALPLKGFLSYTWPIITAAIISIISIAIREVVLIIRTFHTLHAE